MPAYPEETAERMVYLCPSDRPPRPGFRVVKYRVDLTAHDGAGGCACKNFAVKCWPALKAGVPPWTKESCCKHMRRCLWFFAVKVVKRLAKEGV